MAQDNTFTVEEIAGFAVGAVPNNLADEVADRLKRILLDTLGCAIGALKAEPVRAVRSVIDALGGAPTCTLIGGGRSAPERAALYNGCLVRYLDFLDSYDRQGEVCHPADNTATLLAAAEADDASGLDFLTALAVTYQVQCRLLDLPTMRAGVNYTTPLAFSVAAGASRLLGMDVGETANALALAGVGAVSLAVIQAEPISQWKGLAFGEAASRALHNTYLARAGITGDLSMFDGPLGLFQLVEGTLEVDWRAEPLAMPLRTSIKPHNAEFQAQSAVDLAIRLRQEHGLDPSNIARHRRGCPGRLRCVGRWQVRTEVRLPDQVAGRPQPALPRGRSAPRRQGLAAAAHGRAHQLRGRASAAAQGRGASERRLRASHPERAACPPLHRAHRRSRHGRRGAGLCGLLHAADELG